MEAGGQRRAAYHCLSRRRSASRDYGWRLGRKQWRHCEADGGSERNGEGSRIISRAKIKNDRDDGGVDGRGDGLEDQCACALRICAMKWDQLLSSQSISMIIVAMVIFVVGRPRLAFESSCF